MLKKLLWFKEILSASSSESEPQMDLVDDNNNQETEQKKPNNFHTKSSFTNQEIHALLDVYFHRFDEELDQIKTKNSIGKRQLGQHFSREKAIQMTLETERNEYETCGIGILLFYIK